MSDPGTLGQRFEHALIYALHAHGGQTRKQTRIPYIGHLMAVSAIVLEDGGDEDQAIAALLHDAVEDAGGSPRLADVRTHFGNRVADIVDACSDTHELPKPPWLERKRKYIRGLRSKDEGILRVSAADKLDNARAIHRDFLTLRDLLFERFNGKKAGTLWYYACLVNVFRSKRPGSLTDELDRVVRTLWEDAGREFRWPTSEEEDPGQPA